MKKYLMTVDEPFHILGVTPQATAEEVRMAYLAAVQAYPPDRHPDRFAEIHAAYQLASDPLQLAREFLTLSPDPPDLVEWVKQERANPPRLSVAQLLSLGNATP